MSAILMHGRSPPPAKTTLDGRGLFAAAGLWNSHVHFMAPVFDGAASAPVDQLQGGCRRPSSTATRRMLSQVASFASRDGTVLFGTDVGYIDQYDPTEEYRLLAAAGLTYDQVLASLTTNRP